MESFMKIHETRGERSLAWGHPRATVIVNFMPHELLLSCMEDKDATDSSDTHSEVIDRQDFALSCLETYIVSVFPLHCPVFSVKISTYVVDFQYLIALQYFLTWYLYTVRA